MLFFQLNKKCINKGFYIKKHKYINKKIYYTQKIKKINLKL